MNDRTTKPSPPPPDQDPFRALVDLMEHLRTPGVGCPWDLEQTFETIAPYTIEEAYEVADAINRKAYDDLKLELGDLLFQSIFHAQMAREAGLFDIDDVVRGVVDKMVQRHPHVYGEADIATADDQTSAWESMKAAERAAKASTSQPQSTLDDIALNLPALMRAQKLTKRAARDGFDWPSYREVLDKLHEEIGEVVEAAETNNNDEPDEKVTEELGDLLFVCANLCRKLGVDAEEALRAGNRKFERRYRQMEAHARHQGESFGSLTLEDQERVWQAVKRQEKA